MEYNANGVYLVKIAWLTTWSEWCIIRMTSHRPRIVTLWSWCPWLTCLISLACGLSSRFITWVVWSSDCTALPKGLWEVKYPFILMGKGREKQFKLGRMKILLHIFILETRERILPCLGVEPVNSKSRTLPIDSSFPLCGGHILRS